MKTAVKATEETMKRAGLFVFACVVAACGAGTPAGSVGDGGAGSEGGVDGGSSLPDAGFGTDAIAADVVTGSDSGGGGGGGACTIDQTGLAGAKHLTVTMPGSAEASCLAQPLTMPAIATTSDELHAYFAKDGGAFGCPQDPTTLVSMIDFSTEEVVLVPVDPGGPPSVSFVDDTGSKLVVGVHFGLSGVQFPATVLLIAVPKTSPSVVELRECHDTCSGICPP